MLILDLEQPDEIASPGELLRDWARFLRTRVRLFASRRGRRQAPIRPEPPAGDRGGKTEDPDRTGSLIL